MTPAKERDGLDVHLRPSINSMIPASAGTGMTNQNSVHKTKAIRSRFIAREHQNQHEEGEWQDGGPNAPDQPLPHGLSGKVGSSPSLERTSNGAFPNTGGMAGQHTRRFARTASGVQKSISARRRKAHSVPKRPSRTCLTRELHAPLRQAPRVKDAMAHPLVSRASRASSSLATDTRTPYIRGTESPAACAPDIHACGKCDT